VRVDGFLEGSQERDAAPPPTAEPGPEPASDAFYTFNRGDRSAGAQDAIPVIVDLPMPVRIYDHRGVCPLQYGRSFDG